MRTIRNRKYLAYIRGKPCVFCSSLETEPHHVRLGTGGMGLKGNDTRTIPVCRRCHNRIHTDPDYIKRIDVKLYIIKFLEGYIK